ncbi:hypothetical protein [Salinispora arenicola]|uniref:hypothetical protein n=1 Tax=Salinispora arenicola TaxID=168697 RepID=UPI003F5CF2CF
MPESDEFDLAALRAHIRTKLPDYMVPAVFVQLDSLPLTPNGKLDRAAMPEPDFDEVLTYRPPETPLQHALSGLFSSLLDAPKVGIWTTTSSNSAASRYKRCDCSTASRPRSASRS